MQAGWGLCAGDVCKTTTRAPLLAPCPSSRNQESQSPLPPAAGTPPAKEQRPCGTLHPPPGDPPPPSSSRPELASAASLAVPATV